MPGWPDVGRADDRRLFEALRRADGAAPARLFDAYADRLTDYASSRLNDLDAGADAVHNALVAAQGGAGRLEEPGRLRSWLYALTRFQCAARGLPSSGVARWAGPPEDTEDPVLAALVAEALGKIGAAEREALELVVRHGLSPAEATGVLGLTSRQVSARLARAREHVENTAAAVVLARTGRAHCPDLSALVDAGVGASWQDGPLGTVLRKRLSKHIAACKVCSEVRRRTVSAERLLDLIPVAYPPLSLRGRVLKSSLDSDGVAATASWAATAWATAATEDTATRGPAGRGASSRGSSSRGADTGGASSRGGRAGARRSARPRSRRVAPLLLVAACVFGTAGGLALVSGESPAGHLRTVRLPQASPGDGMALGPAEEIQDGDGTKATDGADGTDGTDGTGEAEETDGTDGSPDPAVTTTVRPTVTPPPSTRRRYTAAQPRPRATRSGSAARPPARAPDTPSLSAHCPGDIGSAAGSSITLAARAAPIEWTSATSGGLAVSPARGRLKAGATGRITVAVVDPGTPGSGVVRFASAAGSPSCHISWRGPEETGIADPDPGPSGDPQPSPSADSASASPTS
ncbi:RNA polymerase sigma factor [Microbispora sp. RL4-1S]|uniref:RNA polymerase sigma factor n=1 Tax=Microbispora oryzae TaxID=2806554 RepID=A0A940WL40_9ACTN|nr:RNA polymerase sigma factor [Microbispora oryzae]MBP2703101.1 RNA polymerase sigma factor [Microbispora oryzae]